MLFSHLRGPAWAELHISCQASASHMASWAGALLSAVLCWQTVVLRPAGALQLHSTRFSFTKS